MKILFTGSSSFTGYWFIKALAAAGHEVVATFQGKEYEGVRANRVSLLKEHCHRIFECPFGSYAFLSLLDSGRWDVLCHHAADVTDYKSPQFDAIRALQRNTLNLPEVLERLKVRGVSKVVLTGSVFEQREGIGSDPNQAFSPYGLSKGLTADYFHYYCRAAGIPLHKFIIPNPFGPYEEPRLTSFLIQEWSKKVTAVIKTPDYIRDNIHVSLLAAACNID
jgi:UDP-glucose 4-epimerase